MPGSRSTPASSPKLAERLLQAASTKLENVIERNMEELIERLARNPSRLPREATEQISVARISSHERFRMASDVMEPISTIAPNARVGDAATLLVASKSAIIAIIAIVDEQERVLGVATDRDITRSIASGQCEDNTIEHIMTREIVAVAPDEPILDCVRKLESFSISATPVIDEGRAVGMVSSDLLATKALFRLLQADQPSSGGRS